ncbi:MAG: MFS transporter [Saprospiraceae bacterium]|nr:MFS transporter [Saprospiraceae bacterium]
MLDIQKRLTKSFYVLLSLPTTAMGFALCVQIAALSWILNTKYGLDLDKIGLVWASGPLAGILGQVIVGIISDKVWFWNGRRRPFILIGGTIAALMLLALPNIGVINEKMGIGSLIGVAITVALTLDLAINVSFNPTRSIIADVTPAGAARTKGYTWMQTISGLFGVLAYLIGAFISNYVLIYMGAVLVLLFSWIPMFFIKEPRDLNEQAASDTGTVNTVTSWTAFLKICLAHAFTWLGVQTMFVYNFAYVKEIIMGYKITEELTATQNNDIGFANGIAFAVLNTVGFLLPALVLEPLTERFGRAKVHTICIAIMALGYALIYFGGQSNAMLFVFMAVVGIGWSAVVSLPFAIMSEVVDQRKMGLFMGLFNLSVVLPQLVASGLGGFIKNQPDKSVIYLISMLALAVSAVLWLLVKDKGAPLKGKMAPAGH